MYWWSAAGRLDGRRREAGEAGERVLLVEQMPRLGASDDEAAALAALDNVTVMTHATFGQYDDNCSRWRSAYSDHCRHRRRAATPTPMGRPANVWSTGPSSDRLCSRTTIYRRDVGVRRKVTPALRCAAGPRRRGRDQQRYRLSGRIDLAASGVNVLALVDAGKPPTT